MRLSSIPRAFHWVCKPTHNFVQLLLVLTTHNCVLYLIIFDRFKLIFTGSNKINGHKNRRLYQRINIEENQRPSNAFASSNLKHINNGVKGSSSYLDKDAQFPFGKLKKVRYRRCIL